MFNNEKLRNSLVFFLSFCVLSSKHILIYNEETLVALSFFCFLFFVYQSFGNTIKDSLNERSLDILSKLQNLLTLKESTFKELLIEHKKVPGISEALKKIDMFTNRECTRFYGESKKALRDISSVEVEDKMKSLLIFGKAFQPKLQYFYSEIAIFHLLSACEKAKQTKTKTGNLLRQFRKRSIKKALLNLKKQKK